MYYVFSTFSIQFSYGPSGLVFFCDLGQHGGLGQHGVGADAAVLILAVWCAGARLRLGARGGAVDNALSNALVHSGSLYRNNQSHNFKRLSMALH